MEELISGLAELEKDAIDLLLKGESRDIKILKKQYEVSVVKNRELTGSGFYTYFEIPKNSPTLDDKNSHIGNVGANISGLQHGVGFVIFVENGKISFLECHTYGENFPSKIVSYDLFYINGKSRDRKMQQ